MSETPFFDPSTAADAPLSPLATRLQGTVAQGAAVLVLEADITDEQQAIDAVERTVSGLGRLDTLINAAGVMLLGPVTGAPVSEWQQMVEINVMGTLYCANAARPHLLAAAEDGPRRVADMVNVSSLAGRVASGGRGVYNLTKHGVGAFSEALRREVTRRHVRVSLVEPGRWPPSSPATTAQAAREHARAGRRYPTDAGARHRRRTLTS